MVEEKFRLPLSSYDQVVRIIKAYGATDEPASPDEVGKAAAMHSTIVSRNNAFFVSIGLLERGQKKQLTGRGRALARALDYDRADEIGKLWREIALSSEFLQKLVTAVRIRVGMETSTLQTHIAYSAGEPRRPQVLTGAAAIIDILKTAGLLVEQDGKLVATSTEEVLPEQGFPPIEKSTPTPVPPVEKRVKVTTGTGSPGIDVQLQVQIQVQCSPDELDNVAQRLKDLLEKLSGRIQESPGE